MAFDPNKKYDDVLPAGTYLLAMTSFKRREGTSTRTNKPYKMRSCCFKVFHGAGKGRTFFDTLDMDESNGPAMAAIARLCSGVGQAEPFDLQDDAAFSAVFLGKPFKATISVKQNGDYTNHRITKFVDMTRSENDVADAFWNDWVEKADQRGESAGDSSFGFGANESKAGDWG